MAKKKQIALEIIVILYLNYFLLSSQIKQITHETVMPIMGSYSLRFCLSRQLGVGDMLYWC